MNIDFEEFRDYVPYTCEGCQFSAVDGRPKKSTQCILVKATDWGNPRKVKLSLEKEPGSVWVEYFDEAEERWKAGSPVEEITPDTAMDFINRHERNYEIRTSPCKWCPRRQRGECAGLQKACAKYAEWRMKDTYLAEKLEKEETYEIC